MFSFNRFAMVACVVLSAQSVYAACPDGRPYDRTGVCINSGYSRDGGSRHNTDTVDRNGSCPFGYGSSGGYCVKLEGSDREAIPRNGSKCPWNYGSDGNYCVKVR